jgi:hypothetical protein
MDQLTCLPILFTFLPRRSSFNPSLAMQFIERGVVQLTFALQEQIGAVSSLFKRYENVPASLAPTTRKDVTPLNRKSGGLMEQNNASLQRGDQG